jgi:membrane protein YdbS with pleckstrin-like domain
MANYKNGGSKTNIWVWIVSGVFLLIGITFIVISCFDDMVEWFRTFGITLVVIAAVPTAWVIYKILDNKYKHM